MTIDRTVVRRARPLLGTLVEIGLARAAGDGARPATIDADAAIARAWAELERLQSRLSRHDPDSDLGRFHALPAGGWIVVDRDTARVLATAARLWRASDGAFDVSAGRGGWRLEGRRLTRLHGNARLDLDGIAKGHAVDRAVAVLQASGATAGWVNAGGDLRAFGDLDVPVMLRDEARGGVRELCRLGDGAIATSHYAPGSRSSLWSGPTSTGDASGARACTPRAAHVSVAAPCCLWADALTKIVAATGRVDHPLLARHRAQAWQH